VSPLDRIINPIDKLNTVIGRAVSWLALLMALVQFVVVILRYVFSIGFIPMQELIWYLHGIVFMVGAGYTLLNDGHVRVDVFYREAKPRTKALVDLFGSLFLLLPVCIATFVLSFSYVVNSWTVLEQSTEVSGLPLIFALKTVIWVFAILLGLQGIALMARALRYLRGEHDTYLAGLIGPRID